MLGGCVCELVVKCLKDESTALARQLWVRAPRWSRRGVCSSISGLGMEIPPYSAQVRPPGGYDLGLKCL